MTEASINAMAESINKKYIIKPVDRAAMAALYTDFDAETFIPFARNCVQGWDVVVFFFFQFSEEIDGIYTPSIEVIRMGAQDLDDESEAIEILLDRGFKPAGVLKSRTSTNSLDLGTLNDLGSIPWVFWGLVHAANTILNESRSLLALPLKNWSEEKWPVQHVEN